MKLNAKKIIDAEKLLTRLEASPIFDNFGEDGEFIKEFVLELIKIQPTADVVEVRHGHWEKSFAYSLGWDDFHNLVCSECGIRIGETALKEKDYQYCLHCGAKMDGGRSENG